VSLAPGAARALRGFAAEGTRYLGAACVALAVDFGTYVALIRVAEVHYLVAAPAGFALGLVTIYALSVRWVFRQRRLADARQEFAIFSGIGLAGMALNQLVIYGGVEWLALSPEAAKLVSAASGFCFNFGLRKLLLFTAR
jgi:putative flippase GtrA